MLTFLSSPPVTITRPEEGPSDKQDTLDPWATNSSVNNKEYNIIKNKAYFRCRVCSRNWTMRVQSTPFWNFRESFLHAILIQEHYQYTEENGFNPGFSVVCLAWSSTRELFKDTSFQIKEEEWWCSVKMDFFVPLYFALGALFKILYFFLLEHYVLHLIIALSSKWRENLNHLSPDALFLSYFRWTGVGSYAVTLMKHNKGFGFHYCLQRCQRNKCYSEFSIY